MVSILLVLISNFKRTSESKLALHLVGYLQTFYPHILERHTSNEHNPHPFSYVTKIYALWSADDRH